MPITQLQGRLITWGLGILTLVVVGAGSAVFAALSKVELIEQRVAVVEALARDHAQLSWHPDIGIEHALLKARVTRLEEPLP